MTRRDFFVTWAPVPSVLSAPPRRTCLRPRVKVFVTCGTRASAKRTKPEAEVGDERIWRLGGEAYARSVDPRMVLCSLELVLWVLDVVLWMERLVSVSR